MDVSLLLGVASLESHWADSPMAHKLNNISGATPHAKAGVSYDTLESAWEHWGKEWGPRIAGVGSDADLFTSRLLIDNRKAVGASDTRGSYNSENPDWKPTIMRQITDVRRKLKKWGKGDQPMLAP